MPDDLSGMFEEIEYQLWLETLSRETRESIVAGDALLKNGRPLCRRCHQNAGEHIRHGERATEWPNGPCRDYKPLEIPRAIARFKHETRHLLPRRRLLDAGRSQGGE